MMQHFTEEFIAFFEGLRNNNSKEWFDSNRKIYESAVKGPFNQFVSNLILAISQFDNSIDRDPKNAIFRINRDIRFSKDKTPYNTVVKAAFVKGGRKSMYPGYYLAIGTEKIHIGGGLYAIEKNELNVVRNLIFDNQMEFSGIISHPDFKNVFGEVQGEKSKRLEPEFAAVQNKLPLIANKQFYYMTELKSAEYLLKDNLEEKLANLFKTGHTLNNFLSKALG